MNVDMPLWHACQRITYESARRFGVTNEPPFLGPLPRPGRMPASWLYHKLSRDSALRAKVLP